jgi:hypothetical protein
VIWIVLSIGLIALLLFSLMSMSKHQDRQARHSEIECDPTSDVEITVAGSNMPTAATFNAITERPGGCYTCRYFGHRVDSAVWCSRPNGEHVRLQAASGCALWERRPPADYEADRTVVALRCGGHGYQARGSANSP